MHLFKGKYAQCPLLKGKVVPVHAKKAQRGSGDIAPLILNLAQDGVNRLLHTKAALLLRKEPGTIERETRCVPELVWMF
jgi:hypothetical protein